MSCGNCQCEGSDLIEVRMSVSSCGENSAMIGVNIPKSLESRIMELCAREDCSRSQAFRAALLLGLPICESFPGMVATIDPGPSDNPLDD